MNNHKDIELLEAAHRHTIRNRSEIERSQNCGCTCCERIFPAAEVEEYIDNGTTAMCPYCSCDALVGDAAGFGLTADLLHQLNKHYF